MDDIAVSAVWVGGVPLEIISGDVSDFERVIEAHLANGGGWLYYPQPKVTYRLHVTAATPIIIRHAR